MKILLFIMLVSLSLSLKAQDSINNLPPAMAESNTTPKEISNAPPVGSEIGAPDVISVMTTNELLLSFGVLIFGFLVILVELYLIKISYFDQGQAIKFLLVTLVIMSALFLISAGFSNNQIAPAMGLFGTIAGYLLGKGDTGDQSPRKSDKN